MHYLIDGYNLLFLLFDGPEKLQANRKKVISFLEDSLSSLHLNVTLIFDASHQEGHRPHFEYLESFDVLFTSKGQSADEFILEKIEFSLHPAETTVVTSDKRLGMQCRHLGAHTLSLKQFFSWLSNKRTNQSKKFHQETFQDSKANIQRLLNIFESRLNEDMQE